MKLLGIEPSQKIKSMKKFIGYSQLMDLLNNKILKIIKIFSVNF